ncbi:PAS domain S-box protein [Belliella kenyensis]|uniref:PAS domain S-box protein n=1 Tax=Belliella kenyensis TaxID=1472724 RepID=A0ABV8ESM8_9BACT|nr:PAS domain S-box protein [Belliella kenyensis]MCH7402275.1 PAS domain S-box protein [Belliella kenyensis]MDN3601791.1 PAS domain S-box protein [Belliella kenyensis]
MRHNLEHITFSINQLNRVFPFHFGFDEKGKILFIGPSLEKMLGDIKNQFFNELFSFERPKLQHVDFIDLSKSLDKTFLLRSKEQKKALFRGQFDYFEEFNFLIFLGTPWFANIEEVAANDLTISDFAPLDPLIDLLHLIKNQELVTEDLKELLDTINFQKQELEKLSYVASANAEGVLFTDKNGRITYVNEGFLKETGFTKPEVLGKTLIEIGMGSLTEKLKLEQMISAFFKQEPFKIELKMYRNDGSSFDARVNGQPIFSNKGELLYFFSQIENVTVEKETKKRIKDFEDTFRMVLEFSGDNVWEYNFITNKTVYSNKKNSFFGFEINEKIDLVKLWYESIYEEDLALLVENDYQYRNSLLSSHDIEYRIRLKDGSIKWVRDRGIVIQKDPNGKPLKIIGTHSDITEQKNAQQELLIVNKRLSSVLNELKDVIWSVTYPEFNGIFFTPSAEMLFGLDMNTMMKDNSWWEKVIHPQDLHIFKEVISEVEEKSEYDKNYRIITPDGQIKWVQNKGKLIFENNVPVRMNGILVDITEQKKTEELLKTEENLKNILIEISSTYINMDLEEVDHKIQNSLHRIGKFVNADRAYIFKYDLIEQTCSCTYEWVQEGISEELENLQKISMLDLPYWVNAHQKGIPFSVEDTSTLEEKGLKELKDILEPQGIQSLIAIPMIYKNELLGFVGFDAVRSKHTYSQKEIELLFVFAQMLVNVQMRKQAEKRLFHQEEKFRNIISNMNLGLLEVDLDENVLHANTTFCEMSGYTLTQLVGSKATDLLLDEDSKVKVLERSKSRIDGISDSYELQYKRPDGTTRWWYISGAPNYNDKNELIGSIGIHLDITDQKTLEVELIRQREEAEKSKRAKEIFFANMSHEIRTPMNAIVGMSEQMAKTTLDNKQKLFLSTIQSSASHLTVIIKDILDLSKLEAGKMTLESIGFKMEEVLHKAIQMMYSKAEEKGLDLDGFSCDSTLEPILIGDPYRINQILLNLISNAVKFTEKGQVQVSCKVLKDYGDAQKIAIQIVDTGIGMDTAFVDGNIEKFSQEDSTITRKFGGTGLGLSITKDLVSLMGGALEIKSKKGIGTQVKVTFTLKKGTEIDLPKESVLKVDLKKLEGKRVLVVDDNQFNRLVATTILEQYNLQLTTASNGQEAVNICRDKEFDLVLMDIQMPVMDGVKATRIIRDELQKSVPIIALTAFAMKGDEEKYLSLGMNGYLAKPFQEKDVLKILGSIWEINNREINQPRLNPIKIKQLYSLAELEALAKGNTEFVTKMISIFASNAKEAIQNFNSGLEKGDFNLIKKTAHKVKPSIKMMQITEISDEISELEKEIEGQKDSPRMKYIISTIEQVLLEVLKDFKHKGL